MTGRNMALSLLGLLALANLATAEEVSLSKDVMPLFARSCTGCHQREDGNPNATKDGIYLEKKEDIISRIGTLIIAGSPEKSFLLKMVSPAKDKPEWVKTMPPPRSKAPGMSNEDVQKITEWIKAGAKDN